jgi:putative protease
MPEQQIGTVTHYFGGPSVAVIKIEAGELAVGDTVRFVGHTTDFTETVTSMEVEHQKVERAKAGEEVAVKVVARVRVHDKVMRAD